MPLLTELKILFRHRVLQIWHSYGARDSWGSIFFLWTL